VSVNNRPIPGPRGHPVLGSIREIQKDNVQAFMDAWQEYGDIVHFRGPLTINLLVHPDYVQRVLKDNYKNYPRPEFVRDKLKSIVGEGLVAGEGETWQLSRRMTQPAFDQGILAGLDTALTETTGQMIDRWTPKAERGESVDLKSEMMHISLANLGNALFKADWRADLDTVEPAVAFALAYTNQRLTSPIDPHHFPLPSTRKFHAGLETLNGIIYKLIADKRRGEGDGQDLVSTILRAHADVPGLDITDEQLRDEVIGFFIAGHETVSSCLTWTFYLLSRDPVAWRRVKAEVDEVLGDRAPTSEDVPKLEYIERVLLEALRMYPPIFVLMRRALEEDEIGGYHVPKDATCVLCPYVTHRHPDFWDNPEGFDPDRFLPERAKGIHRMAFFPFSGGPRKCIGNDFAMLQMPIVVAMIAQRFRPALAPGRPVVPEPAISLRPRDPMYVTLEAS